MLWLGSWIVFFGYWFYTIRLARRDGLGIGIACAVLWIVARTGSPYMGVEGPIYFISFSALLTVVMIFIDQVREKMGMRNAKPSALDVSEKVDLGD